MSGKVIRVMGLTGNIGSGKSTVSGYLAGKGAFVLDADEISRDALKPHGGCYEAVIRAFGTDIIRDDFTVDRRKLSGIVFHDEEKRRVLNGIIHPYVIKTMAEGAAAALKAQEERLVIFDVPLLIESGMHTMTDLNVLVYAEDEQRLARILRRDGCSEEEARSRMGSQMPQEEKRAYCQVVLDNSGTLESLYQQADKLYERVCQGWL